MLNGVRVRVSLSGFKNERGENMFKVGNKVFIISVPQKYQDYNLLYLNGTIRNINRSGIIAVLIPGKTNKESMYGYFYFNENNLANTLQIGQGGVKTVSNSTSVVKLWKKRSLEKIEKETNEKLLEILNSDANTHELITCMKRLTDEGYKVEMPNVFDKTSENSKKMRDKLLKEAEDDRTQINRKVEEVEALLEMCGNDPTKEMEILCSYGIVEYPFGRMIIGGYVCDK